MKNFYLSVLLLSCFYYTTALSQNTGYTILLKSGKITLSENVKEFSEKGKVRRKQAFEGKYFALIQFYQLPGREERKKMESDGIILSSYIPNNCYIASLPYRFDKSKLTEYGIRSITLLDQKMKSHPDLLDIRTYPSHTEKVNGKIDVTVKYFEGLDLENVKKSLEKKNCEILGTYERTQLITIRVDKIRLPKIISLPFIFYAEPVAPESKPDDTKGRSLHRSNFINADMSTGLHYDGTGVSVGLIDDGMIGPHIDYQGRLTQYSTVDKGSHGDMTSGILMGAGNIDPTKKGMATGAHLYYWDYDGNNYTHITNAIPNLNTLKIVITSTSYSQGCNDYTTDTELADEQLHENPALIHVFSAGNNNGADCGYGAGDQWGNITGGYKLGKNVIACGNLDPNSLLDGTSSHGPASDGRIKPDICANGTSQNSTDANNTYQVGGGTSAAAPGVAGVIAQLYHAYQDMNGGKNPESGLLKATLLNTADDLGRPGPDYQFGWGRINARKAYKLLAEKRYVIDSLDDNDIKTHTVNVPAGTRLMKVMVYWHDYQGSPASTKALVNDINMEVSDTSSGVYYPLVLNPLPNAATLDSPAAAGVDDLNNVEQVSIQNPAAATYTVTLNGFSIPQGPQKFFLVYEFFNDSITLTYPNGGEGFAPGQQELLRWDAYSDTGKFTAEYSTDSGATWQILSSNIPGNTRQYAWTLSNVLSSSGKGIVRISRGNMSDVNDTIFSIVRVPTGLSVGFACPDSIGLKWSAVTGASQYEIYKLGSKYMEPVGISDTTAFTVTGVNPYAENWFSVAAVLSNGMRGRRALALPHSSGTFNCFLSKDASLTLASPLSGTYRNCASSDSIPVSVKIKNFSMSPISGFSASYKVNNGSTITENISSSINTGDSLTYTFSQTIDLATVGSYSVKSWVRLSSDQNIFNDSSASSVTVVAGGISSLPVNEDFESASFPPTAWLLDNPDNKQTWQQNQSVTGSSGANTTCARINNFSYNARGEEDGLVTDVFDLSAITKPELTFDVAYSPYNATDYDGLRIDISTDCGQTFQPTGYFKENLVLGTTGSAANSQFFPGGAGDWRRDTLDLIAYADKEVIVKFVNINGYGNNLYIDNINIHSKVTGIKENQTVSSGISVFPAVNDGTFKIMLPGNASSKAAITIADAQGKIVWEKTETTAGRKTIDMNLRSFAPGVYFIRVSTEKDAYRNKLVIATDYTDFH